MSFSDQDFMFMFDQQPLGRRLFIEFCNTKEPYRHSIGFLNSVVSTFTSVCFLVDSEDLSNFARIL